MKHCRKYNSSEAAIIREERRIRDRTAKKSGHDSRSSQWLVLVTLGITLLALAAPSFGASECAEVLRTLADVDRLAVAPLDEIYRKLPSLKGKENLRFQLAMEVALRDPKRFVEHVGDFNIRSTEYKLALLKRLAETNVDLAVASYDRFAIPASRHLDALKVLQTRLEAIREEVLPPHADAVSRRATAEFLALVSRLPVSDVEKCTFFSRPLSQIVTEKKSFEMRVEGAPEFFEAALNLHLTSPEAIAIMARKFSTHRSGNSNEFFRRNRGFQSLSPISRFELASILFREGDEDLARVFARHTDLSDLSVAQRRKLAEQILHANIVLPGFLDRLGLPEDYWFVEFRKRIEGANWNALDSAREAQSR
ncbi:MAG: hypothetical protein HY537_15550, partial [Deltaproteobacteria bacterium]|nr:hypothetical protein [Deltaproteobacteria bacterium]